MVGDEDVDRAVGRFDERRLKLDPRTFGSIRRPAAEHLEMLREGHTEVLGGDRSPRLVRRLRRHGAGYAQAQHGRQENDRATRDPASLEKEQTRRHSFGPATRNGPLMPGTKSIWYHIGHALERARRTPPERPAVRGLAERVKAPPAERAEERSPVPSTDELMAAGAAVVVDRVLATWTGRKAPGFTRLLRAGAAVLGVGGALVSSKALAASNMVEIEQLARQYNSIVEAFHRDT